MEQNPFSEKGTDCLLHFGLPLQNIFCLRNQLFSLDKLGLKEKMMRNGDAIEDRKRGRKEISHFG
jgi:hypothetical protein